MSKLEGKQKIFLSACEASGDAHCANLVKAMKAQAESRNASATADTAEGDQQAAVDVVTARLGDFGILSAMDCDDGTVQTRNWRTEALGDVFLAIHVSGLVRDQSGVAIVSSEISYVLVTTPFLLDVWGLSEVFAADYRLYFWGVE